MARPTPAGVPRRAGPRRRGPPARLPSSAQAERGRRLPATPGRPLWVRANPGTHASRLGGWFAGRIGDRRELLAERPKGILVAQLRPDVDEHETRGRGHRDREHDAEEAERRAPREQGEDDERRG